jgi:5-methylthioadenosine/S-adenosylhomocysteine deaminase
MNVIHAIWMDDADYDLIAKAGASVAHNPISNLRLGSGVMPFRRLRDRGINICLGTDEAIADDAVNMWSVIKMAGLIHNIGGPDHNSWPAASEILDCLFKGGANAMRRGGDLGSVAPGKLADLALVNLDTAAFTPLNDVHRQMVYCENGSSVRLTMVAGRVVFDGDRLTNVDEAALRTEAREIFRERQGALAAARLEADRWLPYYQKMVSTAATRDVGMNRWLGYARQ